MLDLKRLEELADRILGALPADLKVLRDEARANIRALLVAALERMDLVTREEFDAQAALLARTRVRLEELERELTALERQ